MQIKNSENTDNSDTDEGMYKDKNTKFWNVFTLEDSEIQHYWTGKGQYP